MEQRIEVAEMAVSYKGQEWSRAQRGRLEVETSSSVLLGEPAFSEFRTSTRH